MDEIKWPHMSWNCEPARVTRLQGDAEKGILVLVQATSCLKHEDKM
jgi:hypothetical protein